MKVKELIRVLQEADQEANVMMDFDGVFCMPVTFADTTSSVFIPTPGDFCGVSYHTDLSASEVGLTEANWEVVKSYPRCVVLFNEPIEED